MNKPWGTMEENGVGKFNDFTDKALKAIKSLGVTHIWYTGVLHHAVINDYTAYGISNDDPDVVKGRAGSPYAIKDYYQVDPDLAENPSNRLEEFVDLINRTHEHGLKVIMDIVPNHVARKYEGINNPPGVRDFGADDDTTITYARDNNFYYNPGEAFKVPEWPEEYLPLGGEEYPLSDGKFEEYPAKWTGNGSRSSQPYFYDWYETVKINYGIAPNGTKDFELLPKGFELENCQSHYSFWKDKDIPDSWKKFKDIAFFWLDMGVDGFRYDMAEMVPVEFWSYLNSAIKVKMPDAILVAEVYNPSLYRDFIHIGKMDYLYDKVELYDTLKNVIQGHGSTDSIPNIQSGLADIEHHMLHFLENHDEQRIASPEFAGDPDKGKPAMVVSATISTSPTMIYFGQETGEPAAENAGFGSSSRTSIFDYIGVPSLQRWLNNKKFDGGQSSASEKQLRDFYKRLLNFTISSKALTGNYRDLHYHNRHCSQWYNDRILCYARWNEVEKLIIVANFDPENAFGFDLFLSNDLIDIWQLMENKQYTLTDQLYGEVIVDLFVETGFAKARVDIKSLQSFIFRF